MIDSQAFDRAWLFFQSGQLEQAKNLCLTLLETPSANTYHLLGLIEQNLNLHPLAINYFEKALKMTPKDPILLNHLGISLKAECRFKEALNSYQQSIQLQPDYWQAQLNMGICYEEMNIQKTAIEIYWQVLRINPNSHKALHNLGTLLHEQGNLTQAKKYLLKALAIKPDSVFTLSNLGHVYLSEKNYEEASQYLERGYELNPEDIHLVNHLTYVCIHLNQSQKAIDLYHKSLKLNPEDPLTVFGLAHAMQNMGNNEQAYQYYLKALQIQKELLKHPQKTFQRYTETLPGKHPPPTPLTPRVKAHYQKNLNGIYTSLLFCLNALPNISKKKVFKYYRESFNYEIPKNPPFKHKKERPFGKPLKIGYVSPEFYQHSAAATHKLLLTHHHTFTTYAYAEVKKADHMTHQFQKLVDYWRWSHELSDPELAQAIYDDQIDILVDLSGRVENQRLNVFLYQPAPIQITGISGFTTGLKNMNYRIADPFIVPIEDCRYNSEKVIYMDTLFHWQPPQLDIEPEPLPYQRNGFITYGSGNNVFKLNTEVLKLWSAILKQSPGSKLALKSPPFSDHSIVESTTQKFKDFGIESSQLIFHGYTTVREHLQFYNSIDIGLDPFPYGGGVSTLECLWMGRPVISIKAGCHTGYSLLKCLKLEDFIAYSKAEYIEQAISLSQSLKNLNLNLRERLETSAICDGQHYFHQLSRVYKTLATIYSHQK